MTGSRSAADALARVARAFFRFQFAEFHIRSPLSALRSSTLEQRATKNEQLFDHFHQMRDPGNHPAHFFRVRPLGDSVHLSESECFERFTHSARAANAAANLLYAKRLFLMCLLRAHASPPCASSPLRPRRFLYSSSLRSCLSASNVALTTLCGFAVPSDFVRMF